jgi:glutaredoxin
MDKQLVFYGRSFPCPDQERALRFLLRNQVPFQRIDIDADREAARRVQQWVGHMSVPTLVIAQPGDVLPLEAPQPLQPGRSIRSQDRGTMITEPSDDALAQFLSRNGLLS